MVYPRNIISLLRTWKQKPHRKPLIIRGARQVGKTTTVQMFAKEYTHFLNINLDILSHQRPFIESQNIDQLIEALFFEYQVSRQAKDVLIFIDEIQQLPQAIHWLRYFYENYPQLHVIAAGSLLESLFDTAIHFPVGRVEYLVLRPLGFEEFLLGMGEERALQAWQEIPLPGFAHERLLVLFHTYTLIGGMPEVVAHYAEHRDLHVLGEIYDALLVSYLDDIEKYARNDNMALVMRTVARGMFSEAGNRIRFQNFAHSNYRSREVGEALKSLEKAFLLYLVYPHTNVDLPLIPDRKRSPRLQVFDTGILNYFSGMQPELLLSRDMNQLYRGKVSEHIVGQELLVQQYKVLDQLHFWVREKKGASAEVDYVLPYEGQLIPIEVKSGVGGKLRSLHYYMDKAQYNMNTAFRLYAGRLKSQEITYQGHRAYRLISLPYYLAAKIPQYWDWVKKEA